MEPELGRLFNDSEMLGANQYSLILGYRVWKQQYLGDKNIIGKKIQLNQRRFTVIGVLPDNLVLPEYKNINQAMWLPLDMDEVFTPKKASQSFMGGYKAVTRINRHFKLASIESKIDELSSQGAELYTPEVNKSFVVGAQLTSFNNALKGDSGSIVMMLLSGVGILMIIALVNLSSMKLGRAESKVKTVAVSYAFGAGSRQLLMESFKHNIIVVGFAVCCAFILSYSSFSVIEILASDSIQRLDTLGLSLNTIIVSIVLVVFIASLYSFIELKIVNEKTLITSLQSSGKGVGKQMSSGTSHFLIGIQITFSFIVLVAASHVVLYTLTEALRSNGLNTDGKWSLTVNYSNINQKDERKNIERALRAELEHLSSVSRIETMSEPRAPKDVNTAQLYDENNNYLAFGRVISVSRNNFSEMGLSVSGDIFRIGDSELENYPVLVNQRIANKVARNEEDAIGKKLSYGNNKYYEIIGIVSNTNFPGAIEYE